MSTVIIPVLLIHAPNVLKNIMAYMLVCSYIILYNLAHVDSSHFGKDTRKLHEQGTLGQPVLAGS